jgi:RimJ/RimL family protein N-acetyltransferase
VKGVDLPLFHALPDGQVVTIRPIAPDDLERLQLSHDRLSPESRYSRFMAPKPHLSLADARYLVDIDGRDHCALVATVFESEGESIAAVARFIRLPDDPRTAEFAIVVGDQWQRQGLAAELLRRLAAAAHERGIERFRALMLAENVAIHRLIESFAVAAVWSHPGGGVTEADFPVWAGDSEAVPAIIAACAGS